MVKLGGGWSVEQSTEHGFVARSFAFLFFSNTPPVPLCLPFKPCMRSLIRKGKMNYALLLLGNRKITNPVRVDIERIFPRNLALLLLSDWWGVNRFAYWWGCRVLILHVPLSLPLTPHQKIPGTLFESSSQFLTLRYSEGRFLQRQIWLIAHNLVKYCISRTLNSVFKNTGTPFLLGCGVWWSINGDKFLFVSHFAQEYFVKGCCLASADVCTPNQRF